MKESELESWCIAIAKQSGWLSYKLSCVAGACDRIFITGDPVWYFLAEIKRPSKTAKLSKNQITEHARLRKHNINPYVIYNKQDFIKALFENTNLKNGTPL